MLNDPRHGLHLCPHTLEKCKSVFYLNQYSLSTTMFKCLSFKMWKEKGLVIGEKDKFVEVWLTLGSFQHFFFLVLEISREEGMT